MAETKFKWDEKALIRESVEITLPPEVTKSEKIKVRFWEFTRLTLVEFVAEAMDQNFVTKNEETGELTRVPFRTVADGQAELLFKYLAKATKDEQDIEFFRNLDL